MLTSPRPCPFLRSILTTPPFPTSPRAGAQLQSDTTERYITLLLLDTRKRCTDHLRRLLLQKDELRHSLRALKQNMGGRLRKLHIILGDWANEVRSWDDIEAEASGVEAESRIGQTPAWLNKEVLGVTSEEGLTVEVHHHSELFLDRTIEEGDETERTRYEERALPTFNRCALTLT